MQESVHKILCPQTNKQTNKKTKKLHAQKSWPLLICMGQSLHVLRNTLHSELCHLIGLFFPLGAIPELFTACLNLIKPWLLPLTIAKHPFVLFAIMELQISVYRLMQTKHAIPLPPEKHSSPLSLGFFFFFLSQPSRICLHNSSFMKPFSASSLLPPSPTQNYPCSQPKLFLVSL